MANLARKLLSRLPLSNKYGHAWVVTHNILSQFAAWTQPHRPPIVPADFDLPNGVRVLKSIFTWWNGAAFGTMFHIGRRGVLVGEDAFGNRYYEAKDASDSYGDHKRRWVIYRGYTDASKVPPEWHGWLHYTFDELPTAENLPVKAFEKEHVPNLTGTVNAWRPKGSIARSGVRPHASGDYQAWTPE